MKIRMAEENDWAACKHLTEILENHAFAEDRFRKIFLAQRASEQYVCLMAEENGRIVGFLNMHMEAQLHHARPVARILELTVDPQWRSQGIGARLFAAAEAIAVQKGCEQIELETSSWRKRAHAFYEREGMTADHLYYTKKL